MMAIFRCKCCKEVSAQNQFLDNAWAVGLTNLRISCKRQT